MSIISGLGPVLLKPSSGSAGSNPPPSSGSGSTGSSGGTPAGSTTSGGAASPGSTGGATSTGTTGGATPAPAASSSDTYSPRDVARNTAAADTSAGAAPAVSERTAAIRVQTFPAAGASSVVDLFKQPTTAAKRETTADVLDSSLKSRAAINADLDKRHATAAQAAKSAAAKTDPVNGDGSDTRITAAGKPSSTDAITKAQAAYADNGPSVEKKAA